jgi:dephospho-CoA kinase
MVFRDADVRKRVNAIIHPRIAQLSAARVAQAQSAVTPYIVYEAPLLVETGAHRGMAALIVVAAASELQVARVMARDGLTEDAARARIAAQLPLETKLAAADYIIHNETDRQAMIEQTLHVHQAILKQFGLS